MFRLYICSHHQVVYRTLDKKTIKCTPFLFVLYFIIFLWLCIQPDVGYICIAETLAVFTCKVKLCVDRGLAAFLSILMPYLYLCGREHFSRINPKHRILCILGHKLPFHVLDVCISAICEFVTRFVEYRISVW